MRLTIRGWLALVLVVVTVGLAWGFGSRSLNAVAAPTIAALLVAAVFVWRADPPSATYDPPRPGFPGEGRTLALSIEGSGLATVDHSLPEGLSTPAVDATVTLPHTVERELTLEERGVYEVGPPVVRQRDPLGLIAYRAEVDVTAELVVYPEVYDLLDSTMGGVLADPTSADRQEFDRLREYVPGDPLKNVHWKSSAKRDDFFVMEFTPERQTDSVSIVAEADRGGADRMASAAATLTLAALEAGLAVELTVPDGHLSTGQGDTYREKALHLLAETGHGSVDDAARAEADVTLSAGPRTVLVDLPDGSRSFESLVTGHEQARSDAEVVT